MYFYLVKWAKYPTLLETTLVVPALVSGAVAAA